MIGRFILTASFALLLSAPALAQDAQPIHGMALHGAPKYAADFTHLDYVNPDAPKGGNMRMSAVGSFDSLNAYIIKGSPAAGMGMIQETLLQQTGLWPDREHDGSAGRSQLGRIQPTPGSQMA